VADVDVRQLRSFVAIAAAGSITQASRELFVAQPALTRQVAALERAVGLQLLLRTATGVVLTQDGRRFLGGAQRVLSEYDRLLAESGRDAETDDSRGGQAGAEEPPPSAVPAGMRLGVEIDAPPEATDVIAAFASGRPGASWRVLRAHEQDLWTMLTRELIDAAVVWLPAPGGGLATTDVQSLEFLVALPDALCDRYPDPVPRRVFTDLPVALWSRVADPAAYDYWTSLIGLGLSGVEYREVPMHDHAQDQMLLEVATRQAATVVTASHWESSPRDGVQARRLDPPLVAPLRLAWRSGQPNAWIADLVSAFAA
jgi:DNA-binding transcriptional LysR family regulator